MPKSSPIHLNDRDLSIFRFLWKWKIATTNGLFEKFGSNFETSSMVFYRRLKKLEEEKFLILVPVIYPNAGYAWTLTEKSYSVFKGVLPELVAPGYKSENPTHDLLVQAAHLGPFLKTKAQAEKIRFISEQELRRVHHECLPVGLPDEPKHRPDGYWMASHKNEKYVVALEVELSRKSSERYRECIFHYSLAREVDAVLWVVESETLAKVISKELEADRYSAQSKHHFVLLSELVAHGWESKIFLGASSGRKVSTFLSNALLKNEVKTMLNQCAENAHSFILDTRISPANFETYANNSKEVNRD